MRTVHTFPDNVVTLDIVLFQVVHVRVAQACVAAEQEDISYAVQIELGLRYLVVLQFLDFLFRKEDDFFLCLLKLGAESLKLGVLVKTFLKAPCGT